MSEIEYDAEMVGAFIAPRPGEYVPSQYAHDLAHMAFNLNVRLAQRDREIEALRLERNELATLATWFESHDRPTQRQKKKDEWALKKLRLAALSDNPEGEQEPEEQILDGIVGLTVIELSELLKEFEEKFGGAADKEEGE